MARQRSDRQTRSDPINSQFVVQAGRWCQFRLTQWSGLGLQMKRWDRMCWGSLFVEGTNGWTWCLARGEFSCSACLLFGHRWSLIKWAVREGKHVSTFYPLELLFIASAHQARPSCGNSIQLRLRKCAWNTCDMLPAVEQLSIHEIIQTLSSHFKYA